jgi:hypothetical protein
MYLAVRLGALRVRAAMGGCARVKFGDAVKNSDDIPTRDASAFTELRTKPDNSL